MALLRTPSTTASVAREQTTVAPPIAHESFWQQLYAAAVFSAIFILLCCGLYPVVVWGIGQLVFPTQANGSLLTKEGAFTTNPEEAVGSALLGQKFAALQYFHPRPSAAGDGYDAANSSGTNLGPLSDKLLNGIHGSMKDDGTPNPAADFDGIKDLVAAYRQENGLADNATVPADAVTRSASGLDPHISLENALLQVTRVAHARGISVQEVHKLVEQYTDARSLGLLGEPGVNVLRMNVALDKAAPVAASATAPR
jgi:potassium-transporting ATPase KdpC subunit